MGIVAALLMAGAVSLVIIWGVNGVLSRVASALASGVASSALAHINGRASSTLPVTGDFKDF